MNIEIYPLDKVVIDGVSAFDTPAEELIKILKQKNDGEVDDSERRCGLLPEKHT